MRSTWDRWSWKALRRIPKHVIYLIRLELSWKKVSQKLTIRSLGERTLMMVTPLSKGKHPRLHMREFGICAVCSMSTFTTQEGKGEPCIGKNTNSTTTNRSTKALQIVKYLEGTFNGNRNLSMGKGCDLYGPSRTTTRTYKGNFIGLAMDRTEN